MPTLSPLLATAFNTASAEGYDQKWVELAGVQQGLHLVMRAALEGLPADARVLVVGAGTGAEVRALAPRHPGWRFTLVDPAAPMLDVARRHAEREGFFDRCTFHVGFLDQTPAEPHHAATSLLVSHFLTVAGEREAYFADIAARLHPGAVLFNADLSADAQAPEFAALMAMWLEMQTYAGMSPEGRSAYISNYGREFGAHPPAEVEAMIHRAGFEAPIPCFQLGLIRGWLARAAAR